MDKKSTDQRIPLTDHDTHVREGEIGSHPNNAREREMGRSDEPAGDLGDRKTWTPPPGEQGISNRADDEEESDPGSSSHGS